MMPVHELKRAFRCLKGCFGNEFIAPYWLGKAEMARCLLGELHAPQQHVYETVDELERQGVLRFHRSDEQSTSATISVESHPAAPAIPQEGVELAAPGVNAASHDRGVWTIARFPEQRSDARRG